MLIPTLALLGIFQGKREVEAKLASPQWQAENFGPDRMGTAPQQQTLGDITDDLLIGYLALLGIVLAARAIRMVVERRAGMINLSYSDGRKLRVLSASACWKRAYVIACRMPASAADARAVRPAAFASPAVSRHCRHLPRAKPSC